MTAIEEYCSHCGTLKKLHPITRELAETMRMPRSCMIDYGSAEPTPLPFEVRALNDDDKLDLQQYWLTLPRELPR